MTDRPGPRNAITDVPGIRVGHHQHVGDGFLTGTTVVLAPAGGALAGVDVRGGGPATQDTAVLDPRSGGALAHAVVLTGGSAYGLATVGGVVQWLAAHGGVPDGGVPDGGVPGGWADPLVPAAALFDLGRGGVFGARPDAGFGYAAVRAAAGSPEHAPVAQGCVGAGTGAVSAEMKGGTGTASTVLPDGTVVGALVAVNAHGSPLDPATGLPLGLAAGAPGEFPLAVPDPAEHAAARRRLADPGRRRAGLELPNTVIGVLATDAPLDPGQAHRMAAAGQRGLAGAVSPVHGATDGDTVFALATRRGPADDGLLGAVLGAARTTFTRAVVHAVLAATSTSTGFGPLIAYRDLYPGACAGLVG